jgi:hypothetical protein
MQFDVTAGHARLRFRQRQSAIESTVERSASFWGTDQKGSTIVTLAVLTSSHEGEVERTTLVEPA